MNMESPADKYLREHSSRQSEALDWIEKQTNIHTNYPRMLSGAVQGRLLTMLVEISKAKQLQFMRPEDGHIDTLEINDELEDLMREGWSRAGVADKITLHIGDACETLSTLEGPYDIVYMDANKREYVTYYNLVFDLVKSGGLILADDVLWDGKLWQDPVPQDKQTQGIIAFNDLIVNDPRVESVLLPLRDGLNVIRKL